MTKLDYTLTSPEERNQLVYKILEEVEDPSPAYLEHLADYLVLCMEKEERRERKLLTENRLSTVNKREISYEGLVAQLENGEDGIYNLAINNKNTIFQPKVSITQKDIEEIPPLAQLREAIHSLEEALPRAEGKAIYNIKQNLIDLRKDQYVIKNAYRKPIFFKKLAKSVSHRPILDSAEWIECGEIHYSGASLCDPAICKAILAAYPSLKARARGDFDHDLYYLLEDFATLYDKTLSLPQYSHLRVIAESKAAGLQNVEIQHILQRDYSLTYTSEYISALWTNKIPKLMAKQAQEDFIEWYYLNNYRGLFKKCGRCQEYKPAHSFFFSKNCSSGDGFYSICKACRTKRKEVK